MIKPSYLAIMGFLWTVAPTYALSDLNATCLLSPGRHVDGFWWRYHLVDNRKCWYLTNKGPAQPSPFRKMSDEVDVGYASTDTVAHKIRYILLLTYNWTGPYVGGFVGYGWSSTSFAPGESFKIGTIGIDLPMVEKNEGVLAGGEVGYHYQVNKDIVLGVEDQLSWPLGNQPVQWENVTSFNIGHPIFARWLVSAGAGVAENSLHQTGAEFEVNSDVALTKAWSTGIKLETISYGGGSWERSVRWQADYHIQ